MKTSSFFKTVNGGNYLFDMYHQQLFNMHPIIEEIHNYISESSCNDITIFLNKKHPEMSNSEIVLYQNKYDYFKRHGLFATVGYDQIFTCNITAKQIEDQIVNLDAITFQVTGACNLNCRYCCYGEMYDNPIKITDPMDFDTIRSFFEYIIPYWKTNPNNKLIIIGFYGGEPLLNFPVINKTVDYLKDLESEHLKFDLTITTNAILLDKYAKYLVDNEFRILFSIDGDEKGNSLRVDKNNKPSFKRVYNSIKKFQFENPIFFRERVNFNSVLNNYSRVEDVNDFIYKEFGKIPILSPISDVGLNKEQIKEYTKIMKPYIETDDLMSSRQDKSSRIKELGGFFYYNLNNAYKHFSEIVHFNKRAQKKIPTGTCLPFYKKVYITADRKIYACERIGFDYELGIIDQKVNIDFDNVARKYTTFFSEIKKQCIECYIADMCSDCIFQFPKENNIPKCTHQCDEESYKNHLSKMISLLEKYPELFDKVNKFVLS